MASDFFHLFLVIGCKDEVESQCIPQEMIQSEQGEVTRFSECEETVSWQSSQVKAGRGIAWICEATGKLVRELARSAKGDRKEGRWEGLGIRNHHQSEKGALILAFLDLPMAQSDFRACQTVPSQENTQREGNVTPIRDLKSSTSRPHWATSVDGGDKERRSTEAPTALLETKMLSMGLIR
jgi:hypothetical protein